MFCNNTAIIHSYETLKPLRSTTDHFVMEVSTPMLCKAMDDEEEQTPLLSPFDSLNFFSNDIEWEKMSDELLNRFKDEELSILSPNDHLRKVMEVLIDVAYKHIPTKRTARKGSHTRIPRERRILMRKRRKLMEKLSQSTTEMKKESIKNKLVKIELLLQKSHIDCRSRREQLAVKAIKTNSKYFFAYAKQFSSIRSSIGPLLNEVNEYTSSPSKMANLLSAQYASVFSKPKDSPYFSMNEEVDSAVITDITFTEQDIIDAIDELKNSSAFYQFFYHVYQQFS